MRNPCDIIDQVLAILPPEMVDLHSSLRGIKDRAGYIPPECQQQTWGEMAIVLNGALSWPPKEEWEKQILALMKGYSAPEVEKSCS